MKNRGNCSEDTPEQNYVVYPTKHPSFCSGYHRTGLSRAIFLLCFVFEHTSVATLFTCVPFLFLYVLSLSAITVPSSVPCSWRTPLWTLLPICWLSSMCRLPDAPEEGAFRKATADSKGESTGTNESNTIVRILSYNVLGPRHALTKKHDYCPLKVSTKLTSRVRVVG